MEKRTSLHSYIERDLRARIVSEHIAPGTALPSISHLMQRYGAGRSTIRNVLSSLCNDGLIELAERRPAVVHGRAHDKQWLEHWEETVLADRYCVLGNYFTMYHLLPQILVFSARYCSARALPGYAAAARADASSTMFSQLLENILASTGPAVQRLLPPFLLHSALPYFWSVSSAIRSSCVALVRELGTRKPDEQRISHALAGTCASVHCIVRELANKAPVLRRAQTSDSSWILFPEMEHHYTRIILDLLTRVGVGGWDNVGLLPSEQRLAAHYGVSISTVREALWRLEEAGFTRTVNGRGTLVLSNGPSIQQQAGHEWLEHILLCALHASQLAALAMPSCACEAAERTTKEDLRALEGTFRRTTLPLRAMFHFVVHRQRLREMRLVLHRVGTLCDCGLGVAVAENRPQLREHLKETAWELFSLLSAGRTDEFAAALTNLYRDSVRSARNTLVLRLGNREARAIHVP